jgi:very-short-patch-repair endonuclease
MRQANVARTFRARGLRRAETDAERWLWSALRSRRLAGFKFVRQEPVGPFFVDFVCRGKRLVVEIDGATHSTEIEKAYDEKREAFLQANGYRVIRVGNMDIYENLAGVVETIHAALETPPPGRRIPPALTARGHDHVP